MKKIDESEVLNMASTIQVRVEDELKSKSDAPMTEAEMLAKLEKSREQRMFRDADLVVPLAVIKNSSTVRFPAAL